MAKTGRPRIEINWDEFDKLCALQCTKREVAEWFKCCEETIENVLRKEKKTTFSAYWEQKAQVGKISLRRKQFEVAKSGNVTMLIWLGKQWLDQRDKRDVSINEMSPEQFDKFLEAVADRLRGELKK